MAAVAQLRQLAVDLLVVGLPEKADRGVKSLGELIARHRPFGQAGEDRVSKRHEQAPCLTLCALAHMRQYAYRRDRPKGGFARFHRRESPMAMAGLAKWYAY